MKRGVCGGLVGGPIDYPVAVLVNISRAVKGSGVGEKLCGMTGVCRCYSGREGSC
jgi:hypothetical protein